MELVEPWYFGLFDELVLVFPAVTFNPFTMVQNILLGGFTFAAFGVGV